MASYQKQFEDQQGRKVDEYGNVIRETDEYGNPIHAASVTYVTSTGTAGLADDTNQQYDTRNVHGLDTRNTGRHHGSSDRQHNVTGDTGRNFGTTGGFTGDTGRTTGGFTGDTGRQHGTTGGLTGDTGRQYGTTGGFTGGTGRQHGSGFTGDIGVGGGPYVGDNTADTGTGPRSGTGGGYGASGGTGYGSGTGYGMNTGGAHRDEGYGREYRGHDQSHGDHDKKGIMDKIKEKLPGGNSDK